MNRKYWFNVVLGISLPMSTACVVIADDPPKGKHDKKHHAVGTERKQEGPARHGDSTPNRPKAAKQIQQKIVAERLAQIRESRLMQGQEATARSKGGRSQDTQASAHIPWRKELRNGQPLETSTDNASSSPSVFGKEWSDRKVDRKIQFDQPFDGVVVTKDKNGNVLKVDLADSQIKSSPTGNPWNATGGPSTNENNNQDSSNTTSGGDDSGGATNSNGNNGNSSGSSGSSSSGSGASGSNPTSSGNRMKKPSVNGRNLPLESSRETVSESNVDSPFGQNGGTMSRGAFRDDGGNPENPSGGGSKFEKPILAGTDSSSIPSGWGICYTYTTDKGESVEIYCRPGSILEDLLGPGLDGDTPPTGGGSGNSNGGDGGASGGAAGGDAGAGNGGSAPGTGSGKGNKKKNKNK